MRVVLAVLGLVGGLVAACGMPLPAGDAGDDGGASGVCAAERRSDGGAATVDPYTACVEGSPRCDAPGGGVCLGGAAGTVRLCTRRCADASDCPALAGTTPVPNPVTGRLTPPNVVCREGVCRYLGTTDCPAGSETVSGVCQPAPCGG